MKLINIFDFDGTLTTEIWPKFWVWVKKFGYSGEKRNDETLTYEELMEGEEYILKGFMEHQAF